jgi:hypothetical protein
MITNTDRIDSPKRWAALGLFAAAGRTPNRHRDPIGFADARTSVCDWRIALSVAVGVPMDQIDPASGFRPLDWKCQHDFTETRHNSAVGRDYVICRCGEQRWKGEA